MIIFVIDRTKYSLLLSFRILAIVFLRRDFMHRNIEVQTVVV